MSRTRIGCFISRHLLLSLLTCGLLAGCSDAPERPEVYPVQGHLSINGQPAEGAMLSLHPVDGENFDPRGSRPWGTVEPDGTFTLSTYATGDGAPAGEYNVSVVWLDNPDAANPEDRLGGRYADPERSEWRVQIIEGENQLEPYRIERAAVRPTGRSTATGNSIEPVE